MTNQEAFDKVCEHLIKQNARSTSGGFCRYRAGNGHKCAIGCLIPDEEYCVEFEGHGLAKLMQDYSDQLPSLSGLDRSMLLGLQQIHDLFGVARWADELKKFAKQYGLVYAEPTNP